MTAPGQLASERDRGERVPRVAEGGEQEPAGLRACAQSSPATVRIMSERPCAVHPIGVIISVPTPASR